MPKLKKKKKLGVKRIAQIEVKNNKDEDLLSNSYLCKDRILHHNCNGPHVPLVVVDEIDTVSGEGLKAFKDISGMLDSRDGQRALRVGISTRKSRYGLMNKQIENAEQAGRVVRYWTALEFTQRCPDDRSGTTPTIGYVLQEDMEVITEEQFKRKSKTKQDEYVRNEFPGEKCLSCPIAALCLGDAKNQTSTSNMLKPIQDPIKKAMENGPDWAISQLFNLKPSVEGIIYKEFDERKHVQDWNGMWKILTGVEYPGECDHDTFVKKCFSKDTEVLTNEGYIPFPELKKHHKIASLDDNGNLIYEKPLDYIEKHYSGEMINLSNRVGGSKQLDLLLTPDHQQTYISSTLRKTGKIKIHKKEIQDLPGDVYIPSTPLADLNRPDMESPISTLSSDEFFSFLGLWISEGSLRKDSKCVDVGQVKSIENVDAVESLMKQIPHRFVRDKRFEVGGIWYSLNHELYDYLRDNVGSYCHYKRIPRSILNHASSHQLGLLYKWMMFGDGSKRNGRDRYYATSSKGLADDFQELCFLLGIRTTLNVDNNPVDKGNRAIYRIGTHKQGTPTSKCWHIKSSTHKNNFSDKTTKHITKVADYNDKVYCVTMPSGRLFVRRNGVIALSGNCHQMKLSCYAGIDWGWSNPSTVVFFFVDGRENVYVVRCEGMTYTNNPTWVQMIKQKWHHMYRCQLYFPDLANPGDAVTMKQEGLPCPSKQTKDTEGGIQVVKKWLRSLASPVPKIYFAKETCEPIIQEFGMYHYKVDAAGEITEDPAKEFDHWLDALRYAMYELFAKSTLVSTGSDMPVEHIVNNDGHFLKTPSAAEFAGYKGIAFNPEVDKTKLGKIGKLSELDPDDDDITGDGSFLWSF